MLICQLASWFDLDFFPNPESTPLDESEKESELQAAWNYSVNPPTTWSWGQESTMNPGPTPTPPRSGVTVQLSTGPGGELYHYCGSFG
jgi:histone-arginine methyltransferase CARM1